MYLTSFISPDVFKRRLAQNFNPLMHGGNKKGTRTETNLSCRFVKVCVTFLLPPGIKGLKPLCNVSESSKLSCNVNLSRRAVHFRKLY